MLAIVLRKAQLLNDFLVALKNLNREEALLLLGRVCTATSSMCAIACSTTPLKLCCGIVFVFWAAWIAASAASSMPVPFKAEISTTLQPSAGLRCRGVDLVAVLIYDVHHVDRNNDRNTELNELGGQVEVALRLVPSIILRMASGLS